MTVALSQQGYRHAEQRDRRSFIGQLLLRRSHAERWVTEDPQTDALAAVANLIDGLAEELLVFFGGHADGACVEARTQSSYSCGRIDLELLVGGAPAIWVEVKDHADESGRQLANYRGAPETPRLVLLNRYGSKPASVKVDATFRWHQLGQRLQAFFDERSLRPEQHWLLHDLLKFLQEKGLHVPYPVPVRIGEIAADFRRSIQALTVMHKVLTDELENKGYEVSRVSRSAPTGIGSDASSWPNNWLVTATLPGMPATAAFAVYGELETDEADSGMWFTAGLRWRTGEPAELVERVSSLGLPEPPHWHIEPYPDDREVHCLRTQALLDADNVGAQADDLAKWVMKTFAVLRAADVHRL